MLKVKQSRLVGILVKLGHKGAGDLSIKKLTGKAVDELPEIDTDDAAKKLDEKQLESFKKIVRTINKDGEWGVIPSEDNGTTEKKDKKPAKKGKEANGTPKERIGVVALVYDMLRGATKESKAISVDEVMKKVKAKFGPGTNYDRPLSGLHTTVYAQLNFQLRKYRGYDVRKTDDKPAKFWLKDEKYHEELLGDWMREKKGLNKKSKKKNKK